MFISDLRPGMVISIEVNGGDVEAGVFHRMGGPLEFILRELVETERGAFRETGDMVYVQAPNSQSVVITELGVTVLRQGVRPSLREVELAASDSEPEDRFSRIVSQKDSEPAAYRS